MDVWYHKSTFTPLASLQPFCTLKVNLLTHKGLCAHTGPVYPHVWVYLSLRVRGLVDIPLPAFVGSLLHHNGNLGCCKTAVVKNTVLGVQVSVSWWPCTTLGRWRNWHGPQHGLCLAFHHYSAQKQFVKMLLEQKHWYKILTMVWQRLAFNSMLKIDTRPVKKKKKKPDA